MDILSQKVVPSTRLALERKEHPPPIPQHVCRSCFLLPSASPLSIQSVHKPTPHLTVSLIVCLTIVVPTSKQFLPLMEEWINLGLGKRDIEGNMENRKKSCLWIRQA